MSATPALDARPGSPRACAAMNHPAPGGLIRWQHHGLPIPSDSREVLAADAVCLPDRPVNKTGTAFTKPVDPIIGQAIEAWQALRPAQPPRLDRKTSENVDMLFVRAHPVGKTYMNRTIIPRYAPRPGPGRRRPRQHHQPPVALHHRQPALQRQGADDPVRAAGLARARNRRHHPALREDHLSTLARAYTEAGYFARNIRTIEILLDREAVTSGAAADGQAALDSLLGRLADIPTPQAQHPASSAHRQRRPSCRSSRSAKANQNETGHLDST